MKVTALVTLSLSAALILFDFDPTTGIRLNNQYGPDKGAHPVQLDANGSPLIMTGSNSLSSSNKLNNHELKKKSSISSTSSASAPSSSSSSSATSSSAAAAAAAALASSSSSSSSSSVNPVKLTKRGKSTSAHGKLAMGADGEIHPDHDDEEMNGIGDLIESGMWPMPIHYWNYLPHTNSINNYPPNEGEEMLLRNGGRRRVGPSVEDEQQQLLEDEEHQAMSMMRQRNRNLGGGKSSHHLSFLPDPDNSVSINLPSNELLGQRLAALNEQLFSNLAPPQDDPHEYDHHHPSFDEGDSGLLPALSILKRTSTSSQKQQQQHSSSSSDSSASSGPMGSRKTEDRKRANRPYDVPQIECPPADDGMERFACPSPDRQGRYRCIDDHVLCDGFVDCPKEEDEDRHACMFYKTTKAHLDVLADALLRWARGRR